MDEEKVESTIVEDKNAEELNKSSLETNKSKIKSKLLYKQIRLQMEFYFSDSNLSKDRFIRQEISKSSDGFVDLDIFLKFNKIRILTSDLNILVKSLKRSTILELNDERNKVKRIIPFVEPSQKDIDKRTVYVERLPSHVNHDLLKKIFSRCGNVTYVSLPKFKSTKQIKGFAFIEFDTKEAAKKAIEMLNDPITEIHENIGKFPKCNKQIAELEEKIIKISGENDEEVVEIEVKKDKIDNKKRKLIKANDSIELSINEPNNKERKVNEKDEEHEENNEVKEAENNVVKKKKKNRRSRKSKKIENELAEEATLLHLRVISKKEWLKLKEEYLNKQKQNLSELKAKLKTIKEHQNDNNNIEMENKKNENDIKMEVNQIDHEYKNCIIKLTPRNTNDEKCYELFKLTRQQFKNEKLKDHLDKIAYVDLDKNLNKIYIRCNDIKAAECLLNKSNEFLNEFNKNLLVDSEENDYINKITINRSKDQAKKARKVTRGKDKIINKANKIIKNEIIQNSNSKESSHVKFDNDED